MSHIVSPPEATLNDIVFQVDASPWGRGDGATLRCNGKIEMLWWTVWAARDVATLNVRAGIPDHQTVWEVLALLLCMIIWDTCFEQAPVLIIGDNIPALQTTLDLKG